MIHRADILELDTRISELLGVCVEDIFWIKFETGCDFLRHWIGEEHADDIRMMEQLSDYWAWWQQVWYIMDKKFMAMYAAPSLPVYESWHDPKRLSDRPNSAIMDSYHQMIKSTPRNVRKGINQ